MARYQDFAYQQNNMRMDRRKAPSGRKEGLGLAAPKNNSNTKYGKQDVGPLEDKPADFFGHGAQPKRQYVDDDTSTAMHMNDKPVEGDPFYSVDAGIPEWINQVEDLAQTEGAMPPDPGVEQFYRENNGQGSADVRDMLIDAFMTGRTKEPYQAPSHTRGIVGQLLQRAYEDGFNSSNRKQRGPAGQGPPGYSTGGRF